MSDQQFSTVGGRRITSGAITIPYYGAWAADVTIDTDDELTGVVPVVVGNLKLSGFIYRTAPFAASRKARLVGGYGGWRKTLTSRSYNLPHSVTTSLVLSDAAKELGEKVNVTNDSMIGDAFVRPAMTGAELLRLVAGQFWYVDNIGVTQVGTARTTPKITSQFDVIDFHGGLGKLEIATESPKDWIPGRTFTAPTVQTSQQVSLSTFIFDNDGKLRVHVLTTGPQ